MLNVFIQAGLCRCCKSRAADEQAHTLRMPAFSDSLLGLGSMKCRLPGSMPCSYARQTLMRPVQHMCEPAYVPHT